MREWETIPNGERLELGIISVDIVGHSNLPGSDRTLKAVKDIFRAQMLGIVHSRDGKLFNWAGDGGSFMFLTGSGDGFDNLVFSALQMVSSLTGINREIAIRERFEVPLDVRIACHSGIATFDTNPNKIAGEFINSLLKNERSIGITNAICITAEIWKQLTEQLKQHFQLSKHSTELDCEIYVYNEKRTEAAPTSKALLPHVQPVRKSGSHAHSESRGQVPVADPLKALQEELSRTQEELARVREKLRGVTASFRKILKVIER